MGALEHLCLRSFVILMGWDSSLLVLSVLLLYICLIACIHTELIPSCSRVCHTLTDGTLSLTYWKSMKIEGISSARISFFWYLFKLKKLSMHYLPEWNSDCSSILVNTFSLLLYIIRPYTLPRKLVILIAL